MKKWIYLLASAVLALLLAGCEEGTEAPWETAGTLGGAVENSWSTSVDKPSASVPFWTEGENLIFSRNGLELPVPEAYQNRIKLEFPEESGHCRPLYVCRERDGEAEDSWIFSICYLDQVGFEEWLTRDSFGSYLFARDNSGYYLYTYPTDIHFARPEEGGEEERPWTELDEWGTTVPDILLSRNSALSEYDVFSLYRQESLYEGAHATAVCHPDGSTQNPVYFLLSQPVRQGEGGVWCVERIKYEYTEDGWTDTRLVFPAGWGVDRTAEDYYRVLQKECDAGEHPELLTPLEAALAFIRESGIQAISGAGEQDLQLLPLL